MRDKIQSGTSQDFIEKLDAAVARHAMLDHPFYRAWNEGALSKETLAEYAKQYYAHVRNFPTYLSAVHSRCDDITVRQLLLENLNDEEQGNENHPELWMRFTDALDLDRDDVRGARYLPKTNESVDEIKALTTSDNYLHGVAALYAYESQIPDVARTKREGLSKHYGVDDLRAVSFFTVHEEADLVHRRQEQEILAAHATDDATRRDVIAAAERSAKALWTFLDGVYEAYCS